jgi:uncharacterized protein (DUF1330 family)
MLYYTQIIFVREGLEEVFNAFEDQVLPLLQQYGGRVLYRLRVTEETVISSDLRKPYEVQVISFDDRVNFARYLNCDERKRCLPLKEQSVDLSILIEGRSL